MAKELNAELLEKERENLVQQLNTTKATVLNASNQVQQIMGAIQMTDSLIAVSKEGNYSKSRANSEGVPEGNAAEVQKSLEEHAKDMESEIGDDDLGKVD